MMATTTKKVATLAFLMGLVYMDVEVAFGAVHAGEWRLQGKSSLWMILVGGMLGLAVGSFNERGSLLLKAKYRIRVMAGMCTFTLFELLSGLVLNKWLGFDLWDYSASTYNFMGQIDLLHSACWLILTPAVFWLDDTLRFYFYKEQHPLPMYRYYTRVLLNNG